MAATTVTAYKLAPGPGEMIAYCFDTATTADSGNTVDVSAYINTIKFLCIWDKTSGDIVTGTESSATITIDVSGGTTDHEYGILCIGTKA